MGERIQVYGGWALAVALLAVTVWQAGDWSRGRYALRADDERVVVERGTRLLFVWEAYDDPNPRMRTAYAPVTRAPGLSAHTGVFGDRDGLDRAFADMLLTWAGTLARRSDERSQRLAVEYLDRAELVPGLSPTQAAELEKVRGAVGHVQGRVEIDRAVAALEAAKRSLLTSVGGGGEYAADSAALAERIDRSLSSLTRLAVPSFDGQSE